MSPSHTCVNAGGSLGYGSIPKCEACNLAFQERLREQDAAHALGLAAMKTPAAFWSLLTPEQRQRLCCVAGPWKPDDVHGRMFARYADTAVGPLDVASVWKLGERFGWSAHVGRTIYDNDDEGNETDFETAKGKADAALRAAGWVFTDG